MLPSVYRYLDYRHFLEDIFSALKAEKKSFSYRSFAQKAKSSSPNFLQLILSRKLNINSAQISAIAESLQLTPEEETYLEIIVAFDHAKTHREKDKYFQRILLTREYNKVKIIDKQHYEYLSHWYNPVIRELVTSSQYPDDPAWISERIVPAVTPGKVKKSIELLETLKLITREESGKWIHTDRTISTPSEVISVAVIKYHQEIISLSKEAIERFRPEERDIRSVTLGVTKKGAAELKKRMEAFWKEILSYSDTQDDVEQVLQVNMQLFPLSIIKEKKNEKKGS